jgi:hypothetical protein
VVAKMPVVTRPHIMALPRPGHALEARLGNEVQLLGYDASPEQPAPGTALKLMLYWRALSRMDESYSVFVHLVDEQGRIWAQSDNTPGQGQIPTTSWLPGEVINDAYQLDLPPALPPGDYRLLAGMYDPLSKARLPVRVSSGDNSDTIDLGTITIAEG